MPPRRTSDHRNSIPLPEVLNFMQVLWRVVHGVERASKQMAVIRGVTGPQRLVLRLVGLCPGVSAGALASTLHVHPSTLTGVLARLERQGLLKRDAHPNDGRRAVLRLTARGQRLNSVRHGTVEAGLERALRNVGPRDQVCARRVLTAVADALGA
jgi:DNA-binding MarR family transcriptional regulator